MKSPIEFRHHEHSEYRNKLISNKAGEIELALVENAVPLKDRVGLLIAARLCPSKSGTYGNIILNFLMPTYPETQAVKFSGGETIPRRVRCVQPTGKLLSIDLPEDIAGYVQIHCPSGCEPGYLDCTEFALVRKKQGLYFVVHLQCCWCGGSALLWFPTMDEFILKKCTHNLGQHVYPATPDPALHV